MSIGRTLFDDTYLLGDPPALSSAGRECGRYQ
jgi:hypothetical protein